jgi:two-component system NarL family response regulator
MSNIRILLVDDHFVVRRGLASSLRLEPDFTIVAEASNGEEALVQYAAHRPDLVIMDWQLPRMTGAEVTSRLRSEYGELKVLVLSAFDGDEHVWEAFQARVRGYVLKSADREELLAAIRNVANGHRHFAPDLEAKLANRAQHEGVTSRERAVLERIAHGYSNKEIGETLAISEGTVKLHINHILQKLDARDRAHAASLAIQRGIIRFEAIPSR